MTFPSASTAIAKRPEAVRAEIASDPERLALLKSATGELASAAERFIAGYVALPTEDMAGTLALWCMHTWTLAACDSTPYILATSVEPGSGKSRLMETLAFLVRKPWNTSSTTPTALFRRMSTDQPTLFLDEVDTVFKGGSSNEALRAILNAGNRRGATATRCDGKWGVVEYETFGAKCMAGLDNGFLPPTIIDRSIVIPMTKQTGAVRRLHPRIAAAEAAPLAYTLEQWAAVAVDELAQTEPELPATLDDRAADAWEPLMCVADMASQQWPERVRSAAAALSGSPATPELAATPMMPGLAAVFGSSLAAEGTTP